MTDYFNYNLIVVQNVTDIGFVFNLYMACALFFFFSLRRQDHRQGHRHRTSLLRHLLSRESRLYARLYSFTSPSLQFEAEFFEDMSALNVLVPHVSTRVSEYIEEIKAFIASLIEKGIAYGLL